MAIINGIEVFIKLSNFQRLLLEFPNILSLPNCSPVDWAVDCKTTSHYIYGAQEQPFEIFIRISEEEPRLGGADGIHISLKLGSGDIVDHFYSIKFSDFHRDEDGMLCASVPSAAYMTEHGFRNVLFLFGVTDSAYTSESAEQEGSLEGVIDVTIIKVTHHTLLRRHATVTSGQLPSRSPQSPAKESSVCAFLATSRDYLPPSPIWDAQ
ncbi:hypothetical protein MGYG_06487 [Nannizzia gypsea CBS 118893]|uniref:Uncharacterized protein n=1 Tax=Arthroderma gypseum (strain ATCC MYA-4604 / CBS 118893) TaxID=535722 RepID=E4UZF9_ARTGP|nr:hypothetical protein MGYG_06487 [Nannizzia gypsea CBS 118893]EFR03489.1 hypothetical protein MGYG_06487 [Nannizzia gypsea CBS 118893]